MTTEKIIKNYILGEIFSEIPMDLNQHPFDFFMASDVDIDLPVQYSAFNEWGYEVCEMYEFESVRSLRGLMQNQLDSLIQLQSKIQGVTTARVLISKSEMVNEEDFEDLKNKPHAHVEREGTADEFVTFITIGGVL